MPMTTSTWTKTHSKLDYEPPFRQAADSSTWDWKQIFTVENMGDHKGSQKLYYSHTSFGYAVERGELQGGYFEDMEELPGSTLTMVKYMLGTTLSYENEMDSIHIKDWLARVGKGMGESHRQTRDAYVARLFNNGFDSTAQAVWDGAAWFDSHTINSGDTVDNDLSPASFSYDSYWDMEKFLMYGMRTQKNLRIAGKGKWLLFSPAITDTVEKTFNSPGEPDKADRNANTLAKRKPILIPCQELSSTTPFFLLDERMKDYLIFINRESPKPEWQDDFVRDGRMCKTRNRFAAAVIDYMFAVGNPGE